MKINEYAREVVASLFLLIALGCFIPNIESLWMPTMFMPSIFFFLVICFIAFAVFIWKEHAQDEREEQHRSLASRNAFLAGSAILVGGILIQSHAESLDPWLLIALAAMILTKMASRAYYREKR